MLGSEFQYESYGERENLFLSSSRVRSLSVETVARIPITYCPITLSDHLASLFLMYNTNRRNLRTIQTCVLIYLLLISNP